MPALARQLTSLATTLGKKPSDIRRVPALLRSRGRGTLAAKTPWLPFEAIDFLDATVTSDSTVFEFGGGGSTLWLSSKAGRVVTVDHDEEWFGPLTEALAGATNVELHLADADGPESDYVRLIDRQADASLDIVIVDGREREACAAHALRKIRPGGVLLLDDSQREEYAPIHASLTSLAWPRTDFFGLVPCKDEPGYTTVWTRPL